VVRAGELGLPYVYLGYWIDGCRKMAYKSRFQPLERLEGSRWVPFAPLSEASLHDT
jgi:arginine-tRNA-protein transferase